MSFPVQELMSLPFLWEELARETRPVVLYGMGNGADRILRACHRYDVHVSGVFASDDFVRGHSYAGFPVRSYDDAVQCFPECTVLTAFGTHRREVMDRIISIAGSRDLHLPDMEVVSGQPYTRERFERECPRLAEAYAMLDGEVSRSIFLDVLRYRITGNIKYLTQTWKYLPDDIPLEGEIIVDGGAYTGDTARAFLADRKACARLIAVEPDPRNFRKLVQNLRPFSGARAVHAALGASTGNITFAAAGGRQAHVSKEGIPVPQITLDSLQDEMPTFIKLDLEGREAAALQGGTQLIRQLRPKLQVSAYHRHADLYAIPRLMHGIAPDYRVRLRTSRCLPAWDMYWEFL